MRIQEFTIDDGAEEALAVRQEMEAHRVSAVEAIRRILRRLGSQSGSPGKAMLGAFSAPEDAGLIDEVAELARSARDQECPRDVGL